MNRRQTRRMSREHKTMEAMISIYCRGHHDKAEKRLCTGCKALEAYAHQRLDRCPFGEKKTTCANCRVHCYGPEMRDKIKGVMRFAGPRMVYQHPILALFHLIDGFRKDPPRLRRT